MSIQPIYDGQSGGNINFYEFLSEFTYDIPFDAELNVNYSSVTGHPMFFGYDLGVADDYVQLTGIGYNHNTSSLRRIIDELHAKYASNFVDFIEFDTSTTNSYFTDNVFLANTNMKYETISESPIIKYAPNFIASGLGHVLNSVINSSSPGVISTNYTLICNSVVTNRYPIALNQYTIQPFNPVNIVNGTTSTRYVYVNTEIEFIQAIAQQLYVCTVALGDDLTINKEMTSFSDVIDYNIYYYDPSATRNYSKYRGHFVMCIIFSRLAELTRSNKMNPILHYFNKFSGDKDRFPMLSLVALDVLTRIDVSMIRKKVNKDIDFEALQVNIPFNLTDSDLFSTRPLIANTTQIQRVYPINPEGFMNRLVAGAPGLEEIYVVNNTTPFGFTMMRQFQPTSFRTRDLDNFTQQMADLALNPGKITFKIFIDKEVEYEGKNRFFYKTTDYVKNYDFPNYLEIRAGAANVWCAWNFV